MRDESPHLRDVHALRETVSWISARNVAGQAGSGENRHSHVPFDGGDGRPAAVLPAQLAASHSFHGLQGVSARREPAPRGGACSDCVEPSSGGS